MLYLETKTFAETNLCAPQQNFLNKHKTRKKKSSNISLVLTLQGNKMNYTNILQANNTLRSKKKNKIIAIHQKIKQGRMHSCNLLDVQLHICFQQQYQQAYCVGNSVAYHNSISTSK